jgi:hypothetical protein
MTARVERSSLVFKLGIFALVAMFAAPFALHLVPPFGFLSSAGTAATAASQGAAAFVALYQLFVLFLRLAGLLLCGVGGLAIVFIAAGLLVLGFSISMGGAEADRQLHAVLQAPVFQAPVFIAMSYYTYCSARKLI